MIDADKPNSHHMPPLLAPPYLLEHPTSGCAGYAARIYDVSAKLQNAQIGVRGHALSILPGGRHPRLTSRVKEKLGVFHVS